MMQSHGTVCLLIFGRLSFSVKTENSLHMQLLPAQSRTFLLLINLHFVINITAYLLHFDGIYLNNSWRAWQVIRDGSSLWADKTWCGLLSSGGWVKVSRWQQDVWWWYLGQLSSQSVVDKICAYFSSSTSLLHTYHSAFCQSSVCIISCFCYVNSQTLTNASGKMLNVHKTFTWLSTSRVHKWWPKIENFGQNMCLV